MRGIKIFWGGVSSIDPLVHSFLFLLITTVFATATAAKASTETVSGNQVIITDFMNDDSNIDIYSTSDNENISFSIPTEVPCIMKANGDVISPSNWQIVNTCTKKIKLSGFDVSDVNSNAYIDMKLYKGDDDSGQEIVSFQMGNSKYSKNTVIAANESISCHWWCDSINNYVHHNATSKIHIVNVEFHFTSNEPTEFAIYSDDDKSLKFYSRIDIPSIGDTFNGTCVTAVYTGLNSYTYVDGEGHNGTPTTPWADIRKEIRYVDIVDKICPSGISFWFQQCESITEFRHLENIDTSKMTHIDHTFYDCASLESIDCSAWDVSNVSYFDQIFGTCAKLKTVNIEGWDTSNAGQFYYMFYFDVALEKINGLKALNLSRCQGFQHNFNNCRSITSLDLSNLQLPNSANTIGSIYQCSKLKSVKVDENFKWTWSESADDTTCPTISSPSSQYVDEADDYGYWYDSSDGKGYMPINMPQNHAATYYAVKPCFAVYSADDESLRFYKRFDKPQDDGVIEEKIATKVYDGIEYRDFEAIRTAASNKYPLLPWIDVASKVKSVNVVDSEIHPKAVSNWCYMMSNAVQIDLTLLDTSRCTDFRSLFNNCSSIKELDLSNMDMSNMKDGRSIYFRCSSLQKIMISDTFRYDMRESDSTAYYYLPEPNPDVIDGADGKWYKEENGEGYVPEDVPNGGKGTYYASRRLQLIGKNAEKWTLNDLVAVSDIISKTADASDSLLQKVTMSMNYGIKWKMTLTDGNVATYRIIGINHDDLSGEAGKAGLTFEINNEAFGHSVQFFDSGDSQKGWSESNIRKALSAGSLWELVPDEYKKAMRSCRKMTDSTGNHDGTVTSTIDKMFLLSESEVYGTDEDKNGKDNDILDEGNQYEYYKNKNVGKRMNNRDYAGINLPSFPSEIGW